MSKESVVEELRHQDWIFNGFTRLEVILGLIQYAGELSEYKAMIEEEEVEKFKIQAYEDAREDFDRRLKQALELK